jgi:uncharacterized protein YndB with AHSA1/START domain
MSERVSGPELLPTTVTLVVRKTIRATAERLFDAWTEPQQLKKWWGPQSVICVDAEVDLRVGGQYRIANQFPDGKVLWISGEFEVIQRPTRLVYTWRLGGDASPERVDVAFEARGPCTEIIVTHERIPNVTIRDRHEQGWLGCLEGLANFVGNSASVAASD